MGKKKENQKVEKKSGGVKEKIQHLNQQQQKLPSLHEASSPEMEDPKNPKVVPKKKRPNKLLSLGSQDNKEELPSTSNPENQEEKPNEGKHGYSVFGVKSYLHQFYESIHSPNTPQMTVLKDEEDQDFGHLIETKMKKGCGTIWFKIGLSCGAVLFLLGAIAIIIGYAIPAQKVIKGRNEDLVQIDRNAVAFNKNLDLCKLIGLASFCSGGLVLVISLLAPTFSSSYWNDEDPATESFRIFAAMALAAESPEETEGGPRSPIPATETIKCIQPVLDEN